MDNAVRLGAGAERDQLVLAGRRIEVAEMPLAWAVYRTRDRYAGARRGWRCAGRVERPGLHRRLRWLSRAGKRTWPQHPGLRAHRVGYLLHGRLRRIDRHQDRRSPRARCRPSAWGRSNRSRAVSRYILTTQLEGPGARTCAGCKGAMTSSRSADHMAHRLDDLPALAGVKTASPSVAGGRRGPPAQALAKRAAKYVSFCVTSDTING